MTPGYVVNRVRGFLERYFPRCIESWQKRDSYLIFHSWRLVWVGLVEVSWSDTVMGKHRFGLRCKIKTKVLWVDLEAIFATSKPEARHALR